MDKELKIRVVFDTGRAKAEVVEYAEGSIGALEKSLREAKLAMKDLTAGTAEHAAALVKLKTLQADVNDAYGRGITAIKNTSGASANAAVTLQALNYTVRDSPYFFKDFSLGILAVGNNLNPLIDGFIRMRKEAVDTNKTFWELAKGTMAGGGGWIFAFSILVTAIQAVTFALAGSREEAKKTSDEFERLLKMPLEELKNIKNANIVLMYREELKVLDEINRKRKVLGLDPFTHLQITQQADFMTRYGSYLSDEYKQMKLINEEIDKKTQGMGRIIQLQNDINYLEEQQRAAMTDKLAKSFIPLITKKKEELDELLGRTKTKKAEKDLSQDTSDVMAMFEKLNAFREKLDNELQEEKIKNIKDEEDREIASFKLTIKKKREELIKLWEDLPLATFEDKKRFDDAMINLGTEETTGVSGIVSKYGEKQRAEMDKKRKKAFSDAVGLWVDEINVVEKQMSEAKTLANDLGTGLIQAFSSGAGFVDSFVRSLEAAIAKMLVMLAIEQILSAIFPMPGLSAPAIPALIGGSFLKNMPFKSNSMELQKQLQTMNMNMVSGQPTILIQTKVPGLEFTKKIINPSQAKLLKGNVISGA